MTNEARFEVGTQFRPVGRKHAQVQTVTDIITWTNTAGEIVGRRYIATHAFLEQVVTDYDVLESTIARGLIK